MTYLNTILNSVVKSLEKKINWIKIDAEGVELEVLKGAHNILSKNNNIAFLIEIHTNCEEKNIYKQIIKLLNIYNFKIEIERLHKSGQIHIISLNNNHNIL